MDFIYSNSLDHSFDPEHCLSAWMSCIREGGVCILEHTSGHELATQLDPFGAKLSQMLSLIMTWGEGQYYVRETLDAPSIADGLTYAKFIIIRNVLAAPEKNSASIPLHNKPAGAGDSVITLNLRGPSSI